MYENYLKELLEPLGVYDLGEETLNGAELYAIGKEMDAISDKLEFAEREGLLVTSEVMGLSCREALFPRCPAAETAEARRKALVALYQIDDDSFTPNAVNRTMRGCGIRARAEEQENGILRVVFPECTGIPPEFEQIRNIILDILPCHLSVEFFFRYLTWEECHKAAYIWNAVEAAGHTWESFQLAVPPEPEEDY